MRKIKAIFLSIIVLTITLFVAEIMLNAEGLTLGFLNLLFIPFKFLFVEDLVTNVVLFIVLALISFGSLSLSRRQERHIWNIVSIIAGLLTVLSFLNIISQG